ncbi:MAG: carbohydrate binding family 9 domain-containing protein, partial [Acidobacteria bacterium]|nr:carbohydrate binding family 9 domain-containing protein [Acidobacteriota bacterium]
MGSTSKTVRFWSLAVLCALLALPATLAAEQPPASALVIPRVDRAPTLEDFLDMKPSPAVEGKLAKVDDFRQTRPSDGKPGTERTEAYLGYDSENLYAVFIAFDSEPQKLRARMVSRENFVGEHGDMVDDGVSVSLDTFNDQRRGYIFQVNPYGVQWDGLYSDNNGFDVSFDTVWHSRAKITGRGFVVWMAIPFKSLRFSSAREQTWAILLNRDIPRKSEVVFWPIYSSKISGYINQAAPMKGLKNISPGRNMQFIPYGALRSFRALDERDANAPAFRGKRAEADGGVDAKLVLKDSLVLDVAVNPDFAQVESDEPQVTANERFELFFPEKRPFFLENASFFQTPINLLFTRRIADPQFGVRLTGKLGPWAVGALFADDQAPGKSVAKNDPMAGQRAYFTVLRVNRD